MTHVIKCLGMQGLSFSNEPGTAPVGQYLEFYDPEAHDGYGDALFTNDVAKAKTFDTAKEAFECWTAVPTNRPTRPDGKANRPLCAFSIEIEEWVQDG